MDQMENSFMKKSQIRPPSKIPSPGRGLAEISESQTNARLKPSAIPPPHISSKSGGFSFNDADTKRKTLAERAGEPVRSSTSSTTGIRPAIKGTSLLGARNTSLASSVSSRAPSASSRNTSHSSLSSSIGPGSRPPMSYSGRPQTSMAYSQSTTGRPPTHSRSQTSMAMKRPASSMDDEYESGGGPADGKRQAFDVCGRLEGVEAMYSELKETITGTSLERNALGEAVAQFKVRLLELESIKARLESKHATLEADLETTRHRLASATASLDSDRRTLDDERRAHRNAMDDESRAHRLEVDDLRRELIEERRLEVENARRELIEEGERLIRGYREEIRELERRGELDLEDERRRRVQEVQDMKALIAVEQQKIGQTIGSKDRDIQNMRGELEDVRGELDREQTLKGNLQQTITESSITIIKLESTVRSLEKHVHFLESGSKAQSDSFVSLEKQLQEALESARESKAKLVKEETLRRLLFNQVQELKGNIRVMCRVRPATEEEVEETAKISIPDSDKESKEMEVQGPEETSSLGKVTRKTSAFTFDRVFGPTSQNEEVFGEISQLVQSALDGYNVCIFCYGQTGSGKTYTMSSTDGMIPRATHMIYETATALQEKGWRYAMEGSFVEVYNEEIHDLLGNPKEFDKKKHEIRHDEQKKQTTITGLKTVPLDSANTVESILKQAAANRSVAATKANERSSRSHSIFILKLIGKNATTNETSEGTLNLVDLAGSERLKQSGAEGDRMKETQNINKSLSCLGDVIGALGQSKEGSHIPYRNSKLTYLLQYSLGGNSKTLMFVMVSPLEAHLRETLTSLKFATKVHNTHIGTAKKSTKSV